MRWTEVTNALRRLEEDQDTLQSDLHERELQRTPRRAPPFTPPPTPPPRRLRASAAVVDVLGMAVAGAAAYHRVRVASPGALQRLGWRYEEGVRIWIHTSTPTSSQGDAGGYDLKTTSWLRHTSSIHGPGQRMECPGSL